MTRTSCVCAAYAHTLGRRPGSACRRGFRREPRHPTSAQRCPPRERSPSARGLPRKCLVPHGVPRRVVDLLQPVEIGKAQHQGLAVATSNLELLTSEFAEAAAIGQASELVDDGQANAARSVRLRAMPGRTPGSPRAPSTGATSTPMASFRGPFLSSRHHSLPAVHDEARRTWGAQLPPDLVGGAPGPDSTAVDALQVAPRARARQVVGLVASARRTEFDVMRRHIAGGCRPGSCSGSVRGCRCAHTRRRCRGDGARRATRTGTGIGASSHEGAASAEPGPPDRHHR